jgi:hypothetical protein
MNAWRAKVERVLHRKVGNVPLYIIGYCGLAGILIDLDHPISYWITGKATRAAHSVIGIACCIILCGIIAYCGRLYYKLILRGKK